MALDEAKRANKPILLSVGYAACHWCHVMAQECFEDPAIAALMNELFVNIKVDREERPDLDTIYQSALALLGQPGGWPLTIFLTPGAEPFWGGTYFPPAPRYGRPGFPEILQKVAQAYRADPDGIARNVAAIGQALRKLSVPASAGQLSPDVNLRVAERLLDEVDMVNGGIGHAPKFPHVPAFELFWRAWLRTQDTRFRDVVVKTLVAMSQGGIYDHLGGGFARYCVDAEWLVPHFEKMLYDNAQLIQLLTLVWQDTREKLFAERIQETIGWLLREMRAAPSNKGQRAFASSLDADSEHEEGKFYVWTAGEIEAALGPGADFFHSIYDVTAGGNWEGKNILNRLAHPDFGAPEEERKLAECRQKLLRIRDSRVRPGWDDKVLADWNALAIAALADAGVVFGRNDWLSAAEDAFGFIAAEMQADDRLFHSWRRGQAKHPATLDDYAHLARASLALFEARQDQAYLRQASDWMAVLDRYYWDAESKGYYYTAADTADVILRTRTAADNALPAANGVLVGVLARLHLLTGQAQYRARAEELVSAFSGELARNVFGLCTLLNQNDFLQLPLQIVLVGDASSPLMPPLRAVIFQRSLPNRVFLQVSDGNDLPQGHPARGKTSVDGKPAAYVCRGTTCSLPITDPTALSRALAVA
jgi:hypothetical protein